MRSTTKRVAIAAPLALVGIIGIISTASAQNAAQAERLFNEAKALSDAGKTREACEAWEASQKLDPSLATITNIANCREKAGDLATAWEAWISVERQTAGLGKYENLNITAKTRAGALESRLSYLTINVPDEVRVEGLIVLRDGVQIDPGAWNRALPVDGGKHQISGRAPGHETWSTAVDIQPENDKQSVEVPRFKAIRNPQSAGKTVVIDRTTPSMFTPRRKIAVGLAAGGVVAGVAAGLVFGMGSARSADRAESLCPDLNCERFEEANALNKKSRDQALYANIGFGVGAAATAGAVVLWFIGKPEQPRREGPEITTHVGARQVGASVTFRF
ncbi:MAG TPA: hypothetical protein VM261_33225 [Kofleriaceae bacterium]|nr:hypothetical protein [Kofleriaceae bacterium]